MPKSEIDKRKARSKSGNSQYSPWATDSGEMAKKTVIRHMWKYLSASVEMQHAVAYDEDTGKNTKDITPDDEAYVDIPDIIGDIPTEGENERE